MTPRGALVEIIHVGRDVPPPPPEENEDLSDFTPGRAHLLLQEVYKDFLHHNHGAHLDEGVTDDSI